MYLPSCGRRQQFHLLVCSREVFRSMFSIHLHSDQFLVRRFQRRKDRSSYLRSAFTEDWINDGHDVDHVVTNPDVGGSLFIFIFGIAKMEADAGKNF